MQSFKTKLVGHGPKGAWVFLHAPFDVRKVFGTGGMVPVKGLLNGAPFRGTLMSQGDGTHAMMVKKELLVATKTTVGVTIDVVMEKDLEKRTVPPPDDLKAAWKGIPQAAKAFAGIAYSHQKEFVSWITEAKRPETRAQRVAKTLEMLQEEKVRRR